MANSPHISKAGRRWGARLRETLLRGFFVGGLVFTTGGCYATLASNGYDTETAYAGGYPVVYAETVPPDVWNSPRVAYEGGWAYWYGDRWYFYSSGRWGYFYEEPPYLYRYRPYASVGTVYYRGPVYYGHRYYGSPGYRYSPPPAYRPGPVYRSSPPAYRAPPAVGPAPAYRAPPAVGAPPAYRAPPAVGAAPRVGPPPAHGGGSFRAPRAR